MKNSNYIINGILIVAVIVLFILQFAGRSASTKHPEIEGAMAESTNDVLPIAFVQTDSLLPNYKFFIDLNEATLKKIEDKRLIINQRSDRLRKEILDFQQRSQMNGFISQEREMQEGNRLNTQGQELENYIAQTEREMAIEQAQMSQQLQDTIVAALKLFNTPQKYQLILSNAGTDNILYADEIYDITKEVTEFLNARYVPVK